MPPLRVRASESKTFRTPRVPTGQLENPFDRVTITRIERLEGAPIAFAVAPIARTVADLSRLNRSTMDPGPRGTGLADSTVVSAP